MAKPFRELEKKITAWFIVNLAETLGYSLNAQFQLQIIHRVHQNAHQQLLVIDPRYHTHRSSGAILGNSESIDTTAHQHILKKIATTCFTSSFYVHFFIDRYSDKRKTIYTTK